MKLFINLFCFLILLSSCKEESSHKLSGPKETLSVDAEAKTISWVGYKTFSFELNEMIANFSKDYVLVNSKELVSTANSLVYSIPSEFRKEILSEKANRVLHLTMALDVAAKIESEKAVKAVLISLVEAYDRLNNEINYLSNS